MWVTDGLGRGGKGHQVFKFSPDGKVLLTLGKAGVAGSGPDEFNAPSAVVVAPNGDIFVADGHGGNTNARIVKFTKDGKFIKTWGKKGSAPGEFDIPHAIAMDSRGRLFVGDRQQQPHPDLRPGRQIPRPVGAVQPAERRLHRQERHHLCRGFRRSESVSKNHDGWKRGIRIGSAKRRRGDGVHSRPGGKDHRHQRGRRRRRRRDGQYLRRRSRPEADDS